MGFDVAADAYGRFMGRYSVPLAPRFADFAGLASGASALDVGCGPGALTGELVTRLGARSVSAIDPSPPFVTAARERHPGVSVQLAAAERLPFADGQFDAALAQLVVHFMADAVKGIREMARVTRVGGVIAACVWDHAGDRGPLSAFWNPARARDPDAHDGSRLAGARRGHLRELFREAGLDDIHETGLSVTVEHPSFEEWWEPFTLGVGPAGGYVADLDPEGVVDLRDACRASLPDAPFALTAVAWAARGVAGVP